jgi:ubiquitin C-terminal hydrolase
MNSEIFERFTDVMRRMWMPSNEPFIEIPQITDTMKRFTGGKSFRIGNGDDTSEAYNAFVHALLTGDKSLFSDFFLLRTKVVNKCLGNLGCEETSTESSEIGNMQLVVTDQGGMQLLDLVLAQFKESLVDGFRCKTCQSANPGVLRIPRIVKAPIILAITVTLFGSKYSVDAPLILDLTGIPSEDSRPVVYRLIGSNTLASEHYTCEFVHPDTDTWFKADDSKIKKISKPSISKSKARMFFYERIDI